MVGAAEIMSDRGEDEEPSVSGDRGSDRAHLNYEISRVSVVVIRC